MSRGNLLDTALQFGHFRLHPLFEGARTARGRALLRCCRRRRAAAIGAGLQRCMVLLPAIIILLRRIVFLVQLRRGEFRLQLTRLGLVQQRLTAVSL